MRENIKLILMALFVSFVVMGCTGFVQKANDYLSKPVTTQPGAPTHEQVITTTTQEAEKYIPAPYGGVLGIIVTGGLLLLHNLDSRSRSKATQGQIGEVADKSDNVSEKIADLTKTVVDLAEQVRVANQVLPPRQEVNVPSSH